MSNKIEEALNIIQYKTGKSLDEIAETIGRTRPYLSVAKKNGKPLNLLNRLKNFFPTELAGIIDGNFSSTSVKFGSISEIELTDMVLQNNAMLSVSLDALAELLAASNPKQTVSEARSSLAKAVEYRMGLIKGNDRS